MRIGVFGGSFDPVHLGHLHLASCCCEQAGLAEVWFVPTAHQPFKTAGPKASNEHRLAMLELACQDHCQFQVKRLECDRGGVSYSVDTLEAIRTAEPTAELFFLMGADTLADFPAWHRPAEICRLATPLVVRRGETSGPNFEVLRPFVSKKRLDQIYANQVEMPPMPVSSSQVRSLIASGRSWQELLPREVADYVRTHQLYGSRR